MTNRKAQNTIWDYMYMEATISVPAQAHLQGLIQDYQLLVLQEGGEHRDFPLPRVSEMYMYIENTGMCICAQGFV